MKRSVAVLAMLALFLSGVLAGVLATHLFYFHRLQKDGGLVGLATEMFGTSLERHLGLDERQKRRLAGILADTRQDLATLHTEMSPRARTVLRRMEGRIDAMLSPQQQEEYRKFRAGPWRRIHNLMMRRP